MISQTTSKSKRGAYWRAKSIIGELDLQPKILPQQRFGELFDRLRVAEIELSICLQPGSGQPVCADHRGEDRDPRRDCGSSSSLEKPLRSLNNRYLSNVHFGKVCI